ncbi:MATE family efflux transporter [Stecheria sp. CLA-KB-P133]|uniref:Probable multidrug resistance protein NorM n=1 Tax=Grylomicrobium aquisgranensis TaxID=2926318 RepID=A0AB35U5D0_9FIRM|nr:MATE family efflux transporter [Stecheria sp. CLA-KB-P133]
MKNENRLDSRILSILIPAILENALLTLSDMILTGYIGRLTVTEISSFGIAERIYGIYFAIFKGFAIGTMVVFAKAYGECNKEKGKRLYLISLLVALPIAVLIAALIWLKPEFFLSSMTHQSKMLAMGSDFLKINALVYPLLAIIHLNSSAFQADGNTRTPLYIALIGNSVSIVFGYILILGIGPIQGLGITGAAITNSIRILVMMLVGIWLLFGRNGEFEGIELESIFPIEKKEVKEILRFGLPTAAGNSFWNFATLFLSGYILTYGQEYYAAYQLGLQGEGFCDMMSAGFLTAAMSLAGKAIGAGDDTLYRQSYQRLVHFCYIISGITMMFLALFSGAVLHLLTDKETLISIAYVYLLVMIFSQYPQHMSKIIYGFIRSSGHSSVPTIIDMVGLWGVRVFLCYLVSSVFHLDILWIWIIIDADQWIRYLLSFAFFRIKHVIDYVEIRHREECKSCHI